MAYTNRTIRIQFDGKQPIPHEKPREDGSTVYYPELGDDIYVVIHNPMLMPPSYLVPKKDYPTDDKGRPVNKEDAINGGMQVISGLFIEWNVPDPFDKAAKPKSLPLPPTIEDEDERIALMHKVPSIITDAVADLLGKARNPR